MRGQRRRRTQRMSTVLALSLALLLAVPGVAPVAEAAPAASAAPGGPGSLSYFGLARKDCVGTARNTTSKVWYTVAGGVLSDVYYPTVDTTNVETLQYIVTDGSSFTDLQTRDMTYQVEALDAGGMACRVTSTAKSGKYRIVTDYITDPGANAVVMRVSFEPLVGQRGNYRLYLRLDSSVNGNGGGGAGNGGGDTGVIDSSRGRPIPVAIDTVTATNAVNRDYAQPIFMALDASQPLLEASSGFVGTASDGLQQLDNARRLADKYVSAANGNLAQTARLDISRGSPQVVVLGFGASQPAALQAAASGLSGSFGSKLGSYTSGWSRYASRLNAPPSRPAAISEERWAALVRQYYVSANVIKASEDKTFPGAIVASLASPWGQAVSAGDPANTYFGSYREIFARDLYETFTALLTSGDLETARATVRFLFERQQLPDGSFPRNSLLNGKVAPDSFGVQLDEVAYPILMAYQVGITDSAFYEQRIRPAADYVASRGPAFGVERWEEQSGFSPSTVAAEIAGLIAAADIAELNGDTISANVWRGVADEFQRTIKGLTVTTNGPYAPRPYFTRLTKNGNPDSEFIYNLGNGGPNLDQRAVVDAGFLELPRLGILPAGDADIARSIEVVDQVIKRETDNGPGFLRYNGDGYGDRSSDGRPWAPSGQGNGHIWPLLSGERGQYELAIGNTAAALGRLDHMEKFAYGVGLIPEQVWEHPDLAPSPFGTAPEEASIGFENGESAGSAAPLTWSMSQYVRLMLNIGAGRQLEQPANTVARYVARQQGTTSLTLSAPADNSAAEGTSVTVSGATLAGNEVNVSATNTDSATPNTTTASTVAGLDGSFSLELTISGGTTLINVVAVAPDGGTALERRTVVLDLVPGTLVFEQSDPLGDDNGPGNYAYPTFGGFVDGAYDISEFQVYDNGSETIFRVKIADLVETFGSNLGAQLIDVYVSQPAAAPTSTAASFPQRNYSLARPWSRLIEVQGFGQRFLDGNGNSVGTVTIRGNPISDYITFSVPTAALGGTPGSGWGFAVVLTGQDGFSPDQARGFQPTPQDFQFGVCASLPSSDPRCNVAPGTVPKALDILTPVGVEQSAALDYTLGPVVVPSVSIP
jgi:glucoamylase